jgi:carbon-monoxide dehydrogenase medium subunit
VRIRNQATMGGNVAHGDYESDPPIALQLLGARVIIAGSEGLRDELLSTFQVSNYETTLLPGELVTAITVPMLDDRYETRYLKFMTGSAEDRPCVGVAAAVRITDGLVEDVRIVVGAVSAVPVLVPGVERLAAGQRMDRELAEAIAATAAASIEPIADVRGSVPYKRHLVRVLVARMLLEMARGEVAA